MRAMTGLHSYGCIFDSLPIRWPPPCWPAMSWSTRRSGAPTTPAASASWPTARAGRGRAAAAAGACGALARLAHRGAVRADGAHRRRRGRAHADPLASAAPGPRRARAGRPGAGSARGGPRVPAARSGRRRARRAALVGRGARRDWAAAASAGARCPCARTPLGAQARDCRPQIAQRDRRAGRTRAAATSRRGCSRAPRRSRRARPSAGLSELYVASLSHRTLVYKALVRAADLADFYATSAQPDFATAFAVFHQRFSTNTLPSLGDDPAVPACSRTTARSTPSTATGAGCARASRAWPHRRLGRRAGRSGRSSPRATSDSA